MKNIAIIPARGGSKRLPNKNIMFFDGIPLLAHSILYAQNNASIIDAVYVSTDDLKIKQIALDYGAQVIDRPKSLSGDSEPTITAVKHALEHIDIPVQNVILLQPTNPLRPENLLQDTYEIFIKNHCDSLFTVTRDYKKYGKIKNNNFIPFNYEIGQRSQDLEPLFYENGLVYIAQSSLILNNILISKNAYPFPIDHPFSTVDIDTLEDFEFAKVVLHQYRK